MASYNVTHNARYVKISYRLRSLVLLLHVYPVWFNYETTDTAHN